MKKSNAYAVASKKGKKSPFRGGARKNEENEGLTKGGKKLLRRQSLCPQALRKSCLVSEGPGGGRGEKG